MKESNQDFIKRMRPRVEKHGGTAFPYLADALARLEKAVKRINKLEAEVKMYKQIVAEEAE